MEDKNLDANQRIELIQQMIRGTRRRLSFGSSNLFLLWGYLLAATAIVIFVLLKTTDCRAWLWLWLPAAATGGAVTWWHNRFRAPQVKSYTDRLLEQIWSCIASLVVLSAILICGYDPWAVDPLFPALLLIGAGLFISGQVIRNKYMYYASCAVIPIGFGITRDSWLNADPDYNLLQFAAAVLIGLTGAGYALRRQVRCDADERRIMLRRIIAFWGDLSLCSRPHFAALRLLYLTLQATVQVAYLIINIIELQFSPCTFLLPIREIFIPFPGFSRYDVPFTNHFLSSFHCFFVGFPCFPLRKCIAIPLFHYATFCFRMSDLLNTSVSGDSSKTVRLVIIVCT